MTLPGTRIIAHKGCIKQSVGWQTSLGGSNPSYQSRPGNRVEQRGPACPHSVLSLSQPSHIGPVGPSHTTEEKLCILFMQQDGGRGGSSRVLWPCKRMARDSRDSPQKLFNHPPTQILSTYVVSTPDWVNGPLSRPSSTHDSATHVSCR